MNWICYKKAIKILLSPKRSEVQSSLTGRRYIRKVTLRWKILRAKDKFCLCRKGILADNPCIDCGVEVNRFETYMVYDHVWNEAHDSEWGELCVGCIESRLGRELVPSDFTHCPMNESPEEIRSERLISRLGPVIQLDFDFQEFHKARKLVRSHLKDH